MKKSVILFLIFLFGCSKEEDTLQLTEVKQMNLISNVSEGVLIFKSTDEAFSTMVALSNMAPIERRKWEEAIGFQSIRSRVEKGFQAIHNASLNESLDMLTKALCDYSDVIVLRDSVYEFKYNVGPFDLISNGNGAFVISNYVQKLNPKGIEIFKLTNLKNISLDMQKAPLYAYNAFYKSNESKSGPQELDAEYFSNRSGCSNDRLVAAHTGIMDIYAPYDDWRGVTYMIGTSGFYGAIHGMFRNWLCQWYHTETWCAAQNISATFNIFQNPDAIEYEYPYPIGPLETPTNTYSTTIVPYYYTKADQSPSYPCLTMEVISPCGHRIINETSVFDNFYYNYNGFTTCHFEGSSSAVNLYENWAVINY